ncbi:MAG: DUF2164 domain-containing protein [Candidatus Marinimicrobia bacterium]|jgi:uncharacterized protein (DUF2164 family)|nr:DUF2164 domain-containing protein [Candidatus Neomarinimicrobiota bacterium]MDP7715409.1 DUF2164 domain-containing protein [Candidatus Neomarinimicrobiota bacterium]HJL74733.1 DUF2164 domain-containing protein [Candidatus Neomarinimicrobiota bacterium]HJM69679.1 DUF2164 domain-containing protein [Candidatus Neomarinimicrobiota bacterium]|tara:strand:- start:864 stop:1109 length:246 start_codon:yes stop_codon:yes gene_type:complete
MINISRKNKDKIVQDLQEWFQENLDQEIGNLDAEFLTDFFTENVGGVYYNQALIDVHTLINEKTESLADNIYDLTKDTSFE